VRHEKCVKISSLPNIIDLSILMPRQCYLPIGLNTAQVHCAVHMASLISVSAMWTTFQDSLWVSFGISLWAPVWSTMGSLCSSCQRNWLNCNQVTNNK